MNGVVTIIDGRYIRVDNLKLCNICILRKHLSAETSTYQGFVISTMLLETFVLCDLHHQESELHESQPRHFNHHHHHALQSCRMDYHTHDVSWGVTILVRRDDVRISWWRQNSILITYVLKSEVWSCCHVRHDSMRGMRMNFTGHDHRGPGDWRSAPQRGRTGGDVTMMQTTSILEPMPTRPRCNSPTGVKLSVLTVETPGCDSSCPGVSCSCTTRQ